MAGGRRQRLSGAARCKFDDPELVGKLDALAKAGEKKGGNTKKNSSGLAVSRREESKTGL